MSSINVGKCLPICFLCREGTLMRKQSDTNFFKGFFIVYFSIIYFHTDLISVIFSRFVQYSRN